MKSSVLAAVCVVAMVVGTVSAEEAGRHVLVTPKSKNPTASVGDLVEIRIPFTSAQDSLLEGLKAVVDGASLEKVGVFSVSDRQNGQEVFGTGNFSLFAKATKAGTAKITLTPIGVDAKEKKTITIEVKVE